ncbi:T-cell receptor beta chain V region PHDS203 [Myotis davidii]|nr:T-cell receptor beta chain V region PHDS203 [Myotis davidii]
MGPHLLGCIMLCLLGAGPTEAEVTQTPRHLITETKKKLTVTCSQNMDHELMYWYRQDPGLGLKLIYYSINVDHFEKGEVSDGYTVSRTEKRNFPLTLESANISQTSLYLCASLMDAEVTQVPRYLIKRKGEKVFMECLQDMDHERMFWYRQDPALGLQLLHFSYGVNIYEKGDFPDGYSVSRKKKEGFSLILGSASTNQTSVYLCASSISTALHNHILSAQKGQVPEGSDPNSGLSYTGYFAQRNSTSYLQERNYTVVRKDDLEFDFSVSFLMEAERISPKDADFPTTSPKTRDICQRGTSVTIQCQVDSQVALMFWYRQLLGQSLTLIATANQGSKATYESGFTKDKFPIHRPNLTFSILTVNSVNPEDSSFYFCSAGDTVPGTDQRSEQELQLPPAHLPPPQFSSR